MALEMNGAPSGGILLTLDNQGLTKIPTIQLTNGILDQRGRNWITVDATNINLGGPDAVNYLAIANADSNNPPSIGAAGTDTNISLSLQPKGSGVVSTSVLQAATGFRNGTLTAGRVLRCDGTNFVSAVIQATDLATAVASDNAFTAAQSITLLNGTTNLIDPLLTLKHNSSGFATTGFGAGLDLYLQDSTTANQAAASITWAWSNAAHGSYVSYMDFGVATGGTRANKMRLFGSGGLSINHTTDPGAGIISANTGYWIGGSPPGSGKIMNSDGSKFSASAFTLDAPGSGGQFLRSNSANWLSATISAADLSSAVASDLNFSTPQTITLSDAETGGASTATLNVVHMTSGTPANVLGTAIAWLAESSTNVAREQARISSGWSTVTDGSRSGYLDFLTVLSTSLTTKMRLHATGGFTVGHTTDPGAGIISANTGYQVGTSASGSGKILISDGTAFKASTPAYPATATASTVVTGDGSNFSASVNGFVKAAVSSGSSTTSTSLVDLAGMTVALTAGTWLWETVVIGQSSSTAGAQFGVNYSGTTTSIDGMHTGQTTGVTFTATTRITAVNTASTVVMTTATTECEVYMTGQIVVSNGGNLTTKGLKVTSGTLTYRSGSWLKATRIS